MAVITRKIIPALLIAMASGMALASQTLVYCSEGSPEGFDSARYTTGITFNAASTQLSNRLVDFAPGSTRLVPSLATKWAVSPDGQTYTFTLRKGVKFHTTSYFRPTRDFNADDVVFTFQRLLDPNLPFNKAISPAPIYPYVSDTGLNSDLKSVEKIDDYTVRFVLTKPVATFLSTLAMAFTSIQSAEYAANLLKEGKANNINSEPIGTGPFVFRRYDKDAQIRYAAFDKYWEGKPAIDNLIFAITSDSAVRAQKLKAGECQISSPLKPQDLESVRRDPAINIATVNALNVGYVAYNTAKKPFQNRDVRLALTLAVDKQAILRAVYQGTGTAAINPIPPGMWSYNKNVKDTEYNPAKAKALLARAGYPDGFETTLWALPVQRPYNPDGKRVAEMIQADWAKIGVKAKIVTYEWGEYKKRVSTGEQDAYMYGWNADFADPDNFLYTLLSCDAVPGGGNTARWCNKEFDGLVTKARTLSNQDERARLYEKAQEVFKREAPWLTLAHSRVSIPLRKTVQGFKASPLGSEMVFSTVSVK